MLQGSVAGISNLEFRVSRPGRFPGKNKVEWAAQREDRCSRVRKGERQREQHVQRIRSGRTLHIYGATSSSTICQGKKNKRENPRDCKGKGSKFPPEGSRGARKGFGQVE